MATGDHLGTAILELRTEDATFNAGLSRAKRGAQDLDRDFTRVTTGLSARWNALGTTIRTFSLGPLSALSGALAGISALRVVESIAKMGVEFERLQARFTAVTGTAAGATQQLAFVRAEADRLGLSFRDTASAFAGIAAAATTTSLGLSGAKEIFTAVAEASAAFGLSVQDTNGVLLAIQQIMSKGVVAAEELRGQIGERLPGAFNIAAKAMGVTTQELQKLLQTGKVTSDQFLPRFADALRNSTAVQQGLTAATQTTQAAVNRLSNAWEAMLAQIANTGPLKAAAAAMEALAAGLNNLTRPLGTFQSASLQAITRVTDELDRQLKVITDDADNLRNQIEVATKLPGAQANIRELTGTFKFFEDRAKALQAQLDALNKVKEQALTPPTFQPQRSQLPTGIIPQATITGLSETDKAVNKVLADFIKTRDETTALGTAMASSFGKGSEEARRLEDQAKNLEDAIEKLLKVPGVTPETPAVRARVAELKIIQDQITAQQEAERLAARAGRQAESQAKRIADILADLGRERAVLPALGQALGESFQPAAENARLTEEAIRSLLRANLSPMSSQVQQLTQDLAALSQQAIGAQLTRDLAAIDRELAVFGNSVQANEARISAYRKAIEDLSARLGTAATPQVQAFKGQIDALEGSLARQQAATRVGDAYRAFAAAVQESAQEFTIFGDVNARVSRDIQSLQTLLQALIREGWEPTSAAVQAVVAQLNALQVPDLGRLLAPIARQAQLLQRTSPLAAPFDVLGAQVSAIRGELERLANDPSINLHSESVQRLSERYQELANRLDFRETARSSFRSINEAFDDLVRGVLEGSQTIEEALKKLPEALILSFTRRMIDAVLIPVENAFIRLVEQLSEFGFAGLFGGAVATRPLTLPNVPSIGGQHGAQFTVGGQGGPDSQFVPILATPGEKVFIVPPHQPLTMDALQRLPRFQSGGTFTVGSPPVAARPPSQSAGGGVIVNITNNSSAQIKTQERRGPKGERQLDVVIEEMVARSLSKPGSAAQSALRNNFQITPGLIGR